MLQPRSYPELVAKALVLENEPFETMVDDDAPWLEGLVLVAVVSLAGGVAVAIGVGGDLEGLDDEGAGGEMADAALA